MHDLEKIIQQLEKIVSLDYCNKLAKEHGLIQRSTSLLKGYEFAQALMIPKEVM